MTTLDALQAQCKVLHLSTMAQVLPQALTLAEQQAWSGESLLLYLLEQEVSERQQRRIVRLLHEAQLPTGKTLATFDQARLPLRVRRQLPWLLQGDVVRQAENVLIFGLPGTGKTHLAAALAYEWIQRDLPVWFTPTFKLVDRLCAPNVIYSSMLNSNASTAFRRLCSMISAMCNNPAKRWKCSLPFSPNAMNAARLSLLPT